MFYFGLPLKSQKMAKDWARTEYLLRRTLSSILRQSDPNFRIVIAAHELPDLKEIQDSRIEIIQVDFPRPIFLDEPHVDKHRKREVIAAHIRKLGGGLIMFCDADDLISNRLVQFVNEHPHPNGYFVQNGYEYNLRCNRVRRCPWFYRLCGSCTILNLRPEDLPVTAMEEAESRLRRIGLHVHAAWPDVLAAEGTPLMPLPFRAVMYVTNTGENMSDVKDPAGWRRKMLRAIYPATAPSRKVANEFGLNS